MIRPLMLLHRWPIPIALSVCCIAYCGYTVQDGLMVCIEVEHECRVDISIGTVFKRNAKVFSLNAIVDVRLRRRHEMVFV